jgi:hypothetical protein
MQILVLKKLLEEKKMIIHLQNQKVITIIDLLLKKVIRHQVQKIEEQTQVLKTTN